MEMNALPSSKGQILEKPTKKMLSLKIRLVKFQAQATLLVYKLITAHAIVVNCHNKMGD